MMQYFFFLSAGFTFKEHGLFIIDFIALVLLLYFFLKKKVRKTIKERADGVRENIEAAEREYDEAKARLDKVQTRIDNLEKDRDKVIENLKREGVREKEQIIADARAMAERIEEEAGREVDHYRKTLEHRLTGELISKTVDEVTEHIKQSYKPMDHARLNKKFISELSQHDISGENAG